MCPCLQSWRRGHPSGAVRADLESSDSESDEEGSDMSEGEKVRFWLSFSCQLCLPALAISFGRV